MSCSRVNIFKAVLTVVLGFAIFTDLASSSDSLPASPAVTADKTVNLVDSPSERTPVSTTYTSRFSYLSITEDMQWSGTVLVQGMVTIAPQATLTILPGTSVRFDSESGLLVLGRVVAKGTAESPVFFTSVYREPRQADWYGVVLTASSKKNIFEQLKFHGAEIAVQGRSSSLELKNVQISDSTVAMKLADSIARLSSVRIAACQSAVASVSSEIDIETASIEKCRTGITLSASSLSADRLKISTSTQFGLTADKSRIKLDRSVFSGNLAAAVIRNSEGSIQRSRFISNGETAILLSGSPFRLNSNQLLDNRVGLQLEDNLPVIWGNSIYGNSSYNLLYLADEKIYLGGNWFGTPISAEVRKTLFSRKNGLIELQPILVLEPVIDFQQGP